MGEESRAVQSLAGGHSLMADAAAAVNGSQNDGKINPGVAGFARFP